MSQKYNATLTMPADRELVITRVFNAPRALVFEAMTTAEHIRQWYGLRSHQMTVCEFDPTVGGRWRYVTAAPDGSEYGFSGVIKEITPPERIVFTEGFEAMPGHDYLVTTTFTEQGNQTTIHVHLLYQSQADRDGHVGAGMERGMNETYDRLDEHLQTLKSAA